MLNNLKYKYSNPPIVSQATTITQAQSNQTSQLPSLTTSTGKLDLANVMKLCGIMDDEDFMDTDEMQLQPPPPPPQCTTSYDIPTSLNATQPSDSDGRPNTLYLDGTRSIDDNGRWLTIPCVQNTDMTNNRVSIVLVRLKSRIADTRINENIIIKNHNNHFVLFRFVGFFIYHTID